MADNIFIAQSLAEIAAYNSGSAKTVLQVIAPANCRVKVLGWGISFDGRDVAAEPVNVELARQTTAGTMSSLSVFQQRPCVDAIASTAQYNAAGEPTTTDVIDSVQVHPQSGYEVRYPYGQEPVIAGGGRMGIRVVAPAAVNCRVKMICEE